MTLSDGDKAQCMEIARAIVKEVLEEHIKSCPHGQTLNMMRAKFIGICIGVGVLGGGLSAAITKLLSNL